MRGPLKPGPPPSTDQVIADERRAGAVAWQGDTYVGYVTSAAWSPVLDKSVMLAWLYYVDGGLPDEVRIGDQIASRAGVPFYDPEGVRARA